VQYYGPEMEERLRRHLKPTNKSWRVDETYLRVKGRWCYLYRAIDFLLSALRDADAAKRLFRKALGDRSHPQPRVINTDLAPIYSSAISDTKKEGTRAPNGERWLKSKTSANCIAVAAPQGLS
jgi:transposase-like protein